MRFIILSIIFLLLTACSTHQGQVVGNRYTTPNKLFSVNLPLDTQKLFIYDHTGKAFGSVDFVKKINIKAVTKYSLEWRTLNKSYTNFYGFLKDNIPYYLHSDLKNYGLGKFTIIKEKKLTLHNLEAYRFIAVNSYSRYEPAVWVVSIINYKSCILVAYLLMPYNPKNAVIKQIPWSKYDHFIASLKYTPYNRKHA